MENTTGHGGDENNRLLMNELKQGMQLAKQVKNHLNAPFWSPNNETVEMLVEKILYSYEKALLMVNCGGGSSSSLGELQAVPAVESPHCLSESPKSEDSDRDFRDQEHIRDASKKRKSMPRWTHQVKVSPGTGLEGPLDDGFSWRKYGQKDILGAKYPRGYYRCTHRHVQSCQATKQVQRSDEDPTVFQITYRGIHTCNQSSSKSIPPPENQESSLINKISQEQQDQTPLFNLKKDLRVETGGSEHIISQESQFSSFHHPKDVVFLNCMVDNSLTGGNISPPFVSPATSGNNYFASPSSGIINNIDNNNNNNNNINSYFQATSESDMTAIIAAATSATNSPTVSLELPFGNLEFDPNFTFNGSGIFPSFPPFTK